MFNNLVETIVNKRAPSPLMHANMRLQHVLIHRQLARVVSTAAIAPPPAPKKGTSSAKVTESPNLNSTAGFTSDTTKVSPKSAPLPSLFPNVPDIPSDSPKLKVAVVGAGLAGLSTAVELLDKGYHVDVYDQRPHVGGKVASWRDKDGNHIEMGLHVFFGCYFNLFRLMAKCGALENLLLKEHAHTFVNEGGDVRLLDFRFNIGNFKVGAPFHGLKAFFTTPQLSPADKVANSLALGTSPVVRALFDPEGGMRDVRALDGVSFEDWFLSHGMPPPPCPSSPV
jgi:zeta-carotene desaturase